LAQGLQLVPEVAADADRGDPQADEQQDQRTAGGRDGLILGGEDIAGRLLGAGI